MSISVAWDNPEKTIIRQTLRGYWEWSEFDEAVAQLKDMVNSVDHTVHIFGDVRESAQQVKGQALEHFRIAMDRLPPNMGLLVIVGQGYFLTKMFVSVARIYPGLAHRTIYVSSDEEAYAALEKHKSASY